MNDTQALPSRADIDVHDSLDGRSACKHFLGKSLDEAEALFRENSHYQDDLMWMGPVAFRFYIRAAIAYVVSAHATGDSDIINGLAVTFSFLQEHYPAELVPIAGLLADFCAMVVEQFDRYDAHLEIDAGLLEKYQQLATIFYSLRNESISASRSIPGGG